MEPIFNTDQVAKNLRLDGPERREKQNTPVPLQDCSNQMTPENILLYS